MALWLVHGAARSRGGEIELSLGQSVERLREKNLSLQIADRAIDWARGEHRRVSSFWYPSVSVTGAYLHMANRIEVEQPLSQFTDPAKDFIHSILPDDQIISGLLDHVGTYTLRFPLAPQDVATIDANVTWPVFAGGKRIYAGRIGRTMVEVAVKLSTGEPGNNNYLSPALIGDLVRRVGGTIVECNTAYGGGRSDTESHLKAAEDHGFTAIAEVDIMDADGEVALPVKGGRHLKEDFVGSHYSDYDFTVVLSHFKGHPMGGFGGAIKNISIGIASSAGKAWIHSAGKTRDRSEVWENLPPQDDFLESMAEAAKAVADYCGDRILYISVANNLSVDCDCVAAPEEPKMGDLGILASLDPVALDRACVDRVRASEDHGKVHLIERIDSRNGMHTLDYAERLGMGSQRYELVELD